MSSGAAGERDAVILMGALRFYAKGGSDGGEVAREAWRQIREHAEAEGLHDTDPGRWGDHASPRRMRRDIARDRDEDRTLGNG